MEILINFKDINVASLDVEFDTYCKNNDEIIAKTLATDNPTFKNTFGLMAQFENDTLSIGSFLSSVHPNKDICAKALELQEKYNNYNINVGYRKDLYNCLKAYYDGNYQLEKTSLSAEQNKTVEDTMISYKRSGIHLNNPEIEVIQKEIAKLCNQFSDNVNKSNTSYVCTKEELNGLQDSWFTENKKVKIDTQDSNSETMSVQMYTVTLKYPDYFPIMDYCVSEAIRKKMFMGFNSQCQMNEEILATTIKLRDKLAKLLGYNNFADYATELRLIKNGDNALNFLKNLNTRFTEQYDIESNKLLQFAQNHAKYPLNKNNLDKWDLRYYSRIMKEETFNIDKKELAKYFPMNQVISGTMQIYQELLGLVFTELETDNKWHQSVQLFQVNDKKTGTLMGHFYLDLYPREDKYGHAAVFPLYSSCENRRGKIGYSLCSMVCNFPKDECLDFDDVTTFFHEFGHVMHFTCARPEYVKYGAFGVETDFVEVPSLMFELWCYEQEALNILSKHVETGLPLSSEIANKVKQFDKFNYGNFIKRQLLLGIFDLTLHKFYNENMSCNQVWDSLEKDISKSGLVPNTFPYTTFGHIMSDYSAGYYSYLSSETYADHIFCRIFKGHVLDSVVGERFRNILFKQGSVKTGDVLFKELVGEELDDKYYFLTNVL
jgi:Zn-dependent oligopeptidase